MLRCSAQLCNVMKRDVEYLIKPKAFVVLRDGFAPCDEMDHSIKEFAKSKMALYKYPRWIEFVDSLPKNDRGKIDRRLLKGRA